MSSQDLNSNRTGTRSPAAVAGTICVPLYFLEQRGNFHKEIGDEKKKVYKNEPAEEVAAVVDAKNIKLHCAARSRKAHPTFGDANQTNNRQIKRARDLSRQKIK